MIILEANVTEKLKHLPEYGMGYQMADVRLNTNSFESGIILNGVIFVKHAEVTSMQHLFSSYNTLLTEAARSSLRVTAATNLARPLSELRGVRKIIINSRSIYAANAKVAGAAKDAEDSYSLKGEIFKRFSAYENDFRVTSSKGLTAGTYATTAEDAINVKTGMEAVARYALENKAPANKVFTITPPQDTKLKRGIVEPAYGEKGGGVEVIFVDGSPSGTVTGPVLIPER